MLHLLFVFSFGQINSDAINTPCDTPIDSESISFLSLLLYTTVVFYCCDFLSHNDHNWRFSIVTRNVCCALSTWLTQMQTESRFLTTLSRSMLTTWTSNQSESQHKWKNTFVPSHYVSMWAMQSSPVVAEVSAEFVRNAANQSVSTGPVATDAIDRCTSGDA